MIGKDGVKCPECGDDNGTVMHEDKFPCKCGETVTVRYHGCMCGFSWRTSDDIFVDGMKIDIDELQSIMENADNFFEGLQNLEGITLQVDPFHIPAKFGNMSDMIHKCIKCNEVAVEKKDGLYECSDPECGFSWEVDEFNGEQNIII